MDLERAVKTVGWVGGALVGIWLSLAATVQLLAIAMLFDVVTGLVAGGKAGRVASVISYVGMRKKAMTLLLVGFGIALERYLAAVPELAQMVPGGGLPLGSAIAFAFFCTEAISILENASALGINVGILQRFLAATSGRADPLRVELDGQGKPHIVGTIPEFTPPQPPRG